MVKRCFPLMLLLAWAPAALAFPPCPASPVSLNAVGAGVAPNTPPWFASSYSLIGDPEIITRMEPWILAENTPSDGGKCKDRLPVLQGNSSSGLIQLDPSYAPRSAFGLLALPDLPFVANDGMRIEYTLRFTVDNAPLANAGDWFDAVQLDFHRNTPSASTYQHKVSAVYRMRKVQRKNEGAPVLEVIESSALPGGYVSSARVTDRVVAVIPLSGDIDGVTPIKLRWTQRAKNTISGSSNDGQSTRPMQIDSILTVFGSDTGVYTTSLPAQWASDLSMGLLDYNVPNPSAYTSDFRVVLDDVWLAAKVL